MVFCRLMGFLSSLGLKLQLVLHLVRVSDEFFSEHEVGACIGHGWKCSAIVNPENFYHFPHKIYFIIYEYTQRSYQIFSISYPISYNFKVHSL